MVVSTDEVHARGVRQVKPDLFWPSLWTTRTTQRPLPKTSAPPPDTDSSILFTLFLGMGLTFSVALCSIVSGVMNMDPGKDSIVYRMTNPKMKKEN
ncbi:ATPase H(+)-transporting accessory protein 2-like [Pectinophora gossypiella]|uniref:ATPase H(+)-transporting accessory protein 2-like n=1 Tax=Pectinophora gossypiella TaxID=13191 RepID=UPI00214F49FB|nr:ATPase H(+)-transporting accessory protein 2-like [Pectinophora gossypiella]